MLLNSKKYRWVVGVLLSALLSSCSFQDLHQAQSIVAQADSLRQAGQMYGIDAGDSATLAQAYETLGSLSLFNFHFSPSYVHACYHYGRLLREKNDPVSAMQAFINATHSRSREYAILGRVYSNMGEIAHLAGEFDLSYDMFMRSGEMYLLAKDTLLYYYDLNNMAFELAEQGKEAETLRLLDTIEKQCIDKEVLIKIKETRAEMYLKCQLYDSAVFYANQLLGNGYYATAGMLIKAQAYSYQSQNDSALFYANKVMSITDEINERYNALYILSHDDSTLSESQILELTSLRDDIHTYELDRQKSGHSRAVQLWKQNEASSKQQYKRFLILLILVVVIITMSIMTLLILFRKRQLLKQEALKVTEQQVIMSKLVQDHKDSQVKHRELFEQNCAALRSPENIKEKLSWGDYVKMCTIVDTNFAFFVGKLQATQLLREREIRLCVLVLIDGFTSKQMAELLFYAESGIRNLKSNTAKKLGTNGKEMRQFLVKMVIG